MRIITRISTQRPRGRTMTRASQARDEGHRPSWSLRNCLGMGQVWKARDTRLDRTVAIKISAVRFSARFEREAPAIAALNHRTSVSVTTWDRIIL